jgi:nucleoside-diphosphate-sugar epimerase
MTEPYQGPVSITTSERVTCTLGAKMVLDILGVNVPIEYIDGETGVEARHCSNAKWERVYGPDSCRSFREGMVALVEWIATVLGA